MENLTQKMRNIQINLSGGKYQDVIRLTDECLSLLFNNDGEKDWTHIIGLNIFKTIAYREKGDFNKSLNSLSDFNNIFNRKDYLQFRNERDFIREYSLYINQQIRTLLCFDQFSEVNSICIKVINSREYTPFFKTLAYNLLGVLYLRQNNMEKVIWILNKATRIKNVNRDQNIMRSGYNTELVEILFKENFLSHKFLKKHMIAYLKSSIKAHKYLTLITKNEPSNVIINELKSSPFVGINDIYWLGKIYYFEGYLNKINSVWKEMIALKEVYHLFPKAFIIDIESILAKS